MRPRRLVMQAFGPYAGRQELDFDALGAQRRFLIHGPTGSGKSSILNAISYALFGEASGDKRPARSMRCDLASPHCPTEVTLDFTLGQEDYRVVRRPDQDRPRKRGGGTIQEGSTATLWRRSGVASLEEDGELLAHQTRKVTGAVERLLGFGAEQFRQVVILPQGRFRELLLARSSQRQEILEALFQTEVYRRLERALKDKARSSEGKIQQRRAQRALILEQAQVENSHQLQDQLQVRSEDLAQTRTWLRQAQCDDDLAQEALAQGRQLQALHLAQREQQQALDALLALEPQRQARALELEQAQRAAALEPARRRLEEAQERAEATTRELHRGAQDSQLAQQAWHQAQALEPGLRWRQFAMQEASRWEEALDRATHQRAQWAQALEALEQAQRQLEVTQQEHRGLQQQAQSQERRQAEVSRGLEESRAEASHLEARQREVLLAQEKLALQARCQESQQTLEITQQEEQERQQLLQARREEWEQEQAELEWMEQAWTRGQAALLAQQLEPGCACPVCGATEHPLLARPEQAAPRIQVLQAKRDKVNRARQRREEAQQQATAAHAALLQARQAHQLAQERARQQGALRPEEELRLDLARAEEATERAQQAQQQIQAWREQLEALGRARAALEQALEQRQGRLRHAQEEAQRLEAVVQERRDALPAPLRQEGAAAQHLLQSQRWRQQLQAWVDASRGSLERAQQQLQAAQQAHEAARLHAQAQALALQQAREAWAEASALHGMDQEQWAQAWREPGALQALARHQAESLAALEQARALLWQTREKLQGAAPPELERLEEEARQARHRREALIRQEAEAEAQEAQLRQLGRRLEEASQALEALEEGHSVLGRLHQVASGRNELRMTFQRFVLAALLDQVTDMATRRLRVMSHGRYELRRAADPEAKHSAGGLELEVWDHYTGAARDVVTLSGGESFLAALALALGMADVVQSYAGGVHMEAIFIDEGFGSLDAESMELALEALTRLEAGGRMVGIISHVAELRERIPAQLAITPGRAGSRASFC